MGVELGAISQYKTGCPECAATIVVQPDLQNGEIYPCPDCGLDLVFNGEYKNGCPVLEKLELKEKEDWGE